MIDKYERNINYLRVSVTDRCNLRCMYCMPKEGVSWLGHNDILRYEEILRIVRIAATKGIGKVRVTGGEPLVRKGVVDFLSELSGIEGLHDISLTTNGILLEKMAKPLYEAGIRRINVSLDSLVPERYYNITRGGDLNRVLKGLEEAERVGFDPIKINVVIIKDFNEDEIDRFVRLALEQSYQVRFIEYMPIGDNMEQDFQHLPSDKIVQWINTKIPLEPLNTPPGSLDGPARLYRVVGTEGIIGFIGAMSSHLCAACNRLRLTSDGRLRACLMSDEPEIDLKPSLRRGCSDSHLQMLIEKIISMKPEGNRSHLLHPRRKKCVRTMSSIGG